MAAVQIRRPRQGYAVPEDGSDEIAAQAGANSVSRDTHWCRLRLHTFVSAVGAYCAAMSIFEVRLVCLDASLTLLVVGYEQAAQRPQTQTRGAAR